MHHLQRALVRKLVADVDGCIQARKLIRWHVNSNAAIFSHL
jgi:hypothetical protein